MLSKCGALLVGGVVLSAAAAQAGVGVYYIETYLDTHWANTTSSVVTDQFGPAHQNQFGSTSSPGYLAVPWPFDESSSIAATPQSIVGTGGYATADTFTEFTISPDGFSLHSKGDVAAYRGADATAQSITADTYTVTKFNFRVPSSSVGYEMYLNGFAKAEARSALFVRISEMPDDLSSTSDLVYINRTNSNIVAYNKTWDNEAFALNPGHLYVVDVYVTPLATVTAMDFGPVTRSSELNLTATFVPIPEPGVAALVLGSSLLLLRRERRRVAQA